MTYIPRVIALIFIFSLGIFAQALGTAGTLSGTVTDPNGAVVSGATLTLSNALTGYSRTVTSDASGNYRFNDVPPNNYTLKVTAAGFRTSALGPVVRSTVPLNLPVSLVLAGATATVDI